MAISVLLRAVTRRSQLSACISSCESVFRNANTPRIPWGGYALGKNILIIRIFSNFSKPDHNDLAAQNETKRPFVSNPMKIIFKYVCATDEPQEDSKCIKVRKIVETPTGDALFGLSKGGDRYYSLSFFYLYVQGDYFYAAQSLSGRRVSEFCVVVPSYFKQNLDSVEFSSGLHDGIFSGPGIIYVSCDLRDFISTRTREILTSGNRIVLNSSTGCIKLTLDFDDFFDVRIWEILTNGEKTVLEIIVSQLKRNGFDFTEDPLALQKLEQAVERAIARRTNAVKLNLPVPSGHPEMSTTVSWGTSDEFYARFGNSYDCYTCCTH
ncbi:hypothetical protein MKW94_000059 [Papaver nudicaule]|uniref:Uncharacterized protein n=1 Tax=Papaver nudicaule TaxID=74823 RepID=A0AA41W393_PAPNU|nr:hypothetical protein [Papaver nudicaule]